jgi:hypothetical protein
MKKCKCSYILTDEQREKSSRIVEELRKKNAKYDFIICESVFDASEYFEPTKEESEELEDD